LFRRGRGAGAIAFAAAALAAPATAQATDYPVTNASDTGGGSLREAITLANGNAGPDSITINVPSPPNTVTLGSALPAISGDVTIAGPGQGQFTIDGVDTYQPFKVNFGPTVSISGLTITRGLCDAGCGFSGGGILNHGTLTLSGVTVRSSTSTEGGGIYSDGTLTLDSATVTSNTAAASGGTDAFAIGGGIANNGGTLSLVLSTVSGNTASATGATNQNAPEAGGIFSNTGGPVTIDRSTVSSNSATAVAGAGGTTNANGGGIENRTTMTLFRSTVSNNTASGTNGTTNTARGAGITNSATASVSVDRSTVSGNTVTASNTNQGGGILANGTAFSVTSSTIAHNSAAFGANIEFDAATTVKNSIVSSPGSGANCLGGANVTSQGYNLEDANSCGFGQATDHPSTNPMLAGSLASNGGPTQTYALQTGSPAIDQGKASAGETVDQRGEARPSDFGAITNASGGDGSDIGAFEVQDTDPPDTNITSGPADGSTINDPTPTFGFTATEAGSHFECKVDSGSYATCTSPYATATLADGSHTFYVRAVDAASNPDPSPASRTFTVDATPPDTAITSGPANGSVTANPSPSFDFAANEAGSTFECKVDSGVFAACTSPFSPGLLTDGAHTVSVRATDPAGNVEVDPATRSFTVDTTAPQTTITKHPPRRTHSRRPRFVFRSSEAGSSFQCKLDRKPFKPCHSPFRPKRKLSFGPHTFKVRATDQAGNVDNTPAKSRFTIVRLV